MGDFPCEKCPYSPNYQGDRSSIPFLCKRDRNAMLKPANRYVLNRVRSEISEQDVLMCREGVRAWESEYHYTPSRKRPEKFRFLYITDHHLADMFVITKVYRDGSIEEYFRCKKQMFGLENSMVRSLTAINSLNFFLSVDMLFLAILRETSERNMHFSICVEAAAPIKPKVCFFYYRLVEGLHFLLSKAHTGIRGYFKPLRPNQRQMKIQGFA